MESRHTNGAEGAAARFSHMRSPALVQDCVVQGASSSLCSCVYMDHNNPIVIGLKHNQNKKVTCKHVNRIELARSD